jgi:hypothetical protein
MQNADQNVVVGPFSNIQRQELDMLLRQLNQRPAPTPEQIAFQEHQLDMQHRQETMAGVAGFVLMMPIVIAIAVRLVRRGRQAPVVQRAALDDERFNRLEQAVDAIAVEIERIGEAQRFQTRLMSEGAASAAKVTPRLQVKTPV